MKIAITGHTSGIGQGIYQYFEKQGHDVRGYSRSNGWTLPECESRLLDEIADCDLFVNNSLPVGSQMFLLKETWARWKNTNKTVLVTGSLIADIQFPATMAQVPTYQQEKQQLDILCKQLRYDNSGPRLISISPGATDTNFYNEFGIHDFPWAKCSVQQVVEVLDFIMRSPVKIDNVVFGAK